MMYIIMPAYNEEENLSGLIPKIDTTLKAAGLQYKVLVVNDGSKDRTEHVSLDLANRFPVEVLNHHVNKGVGAAYDTGLRNASLRAGPNDVVVLMEADSTNDPKPIPLMARMILSNKCDVVIGSRYQKKGGYYKFPLKRLILSKGANFIFRLLFPIKNVRDYTIFFRAYSGSILRRAIEYYKDGFVNEKSFVCNAAILVRLKRFNVRVEEIPMEYRYDLKKGASKMHIKNNLKEYMRFIFSTLKENMLNGNRRT